MTKTELAALLAEALERDPLEWAAMRQHITAVEEADREDEEG